ncbi:serine/threonine-protein kinase/receptor [Acrasis kona]|uniref:Serine/threonine-protein kinase/receptor n=1 Tax=Acrasis kona TaxID=1008807 RepID=A0AAW2Z100_9EUKA
MSEIIKSTTPMNIFFPTPVRINNIDVALQVQCRLVYSSVLTAKGIYIWGGKYGSGVHVKIPNLSVSSYFYDLSILYVFTKTNRLYAVTLSKSGVESMRLIASDVVSIHHSNSEMLFLMSDKTVVKYEYLEEKMSLIASDVSSIVVFTSVESYRDLIYQSVSGDYFINVQDTLGRSNTYIKMVDGSEIKNVRQIDFMTGHEYTVIQTENDTSLSLISLSFRAIKISQAFALTDDGCLVKYDLEKTCSDFTRSILDVSTFEDKTNIMVMKNGSVIQESSGLVDGIEGAVEVCTGKHHSVVRCSDGTVYTMSANEYGNAYGQLGIGNRQNKLLPTVIPIKFKKIECGGFSTLGLSSDGDVYFWGTLGFDGSLSAVPPPPKTLPTRLEAPLGVKFRSISIGFEHVVAVSQDDTLFAQGSNSRGQFGDLQIMQSNGLINVGYHASNKTIKNAFASGYSTFITMKCSDDFYGDYCENRKCVGREYYNSTLNKCTCNPLYFGPGCSIYLVNFLIACLLVAVFIILLPVLYKITKLILALIKQHKVRRQMYAILQDRLAQTEDKLEHSNQGWMINLEDLVFVERITEGTYGVVFKGKYLESRVAIKLIKNSCSALDLDDEFVKEVEILKSLRHRNIVQFFGACVNQHNKLIITEFMDGTSLDSIFLKKQELGFNKKIDLLLDIAMGMNYLHQLSLVHRDLKLSNVLVDQGFNIAKICDFGISKFVGDDQIMTFNVGTRAYNAPEILSYQAYDKSCDVYSFAIMMYEVFYEKEAYSRLFPIEVAVLRGERPHIFEELLTNKDAEFMELVKQCWHHNKDQRPTFKEIIKRLQIIQETSYR